MDNIISNQKLELSRLLAHPYIPRLAEEAFEVYLSSPLIKLITGPRRAGKSSFAIHMLKGRRFAYLNFDDRRLVDEFDEDTILDSLEEAYPQYDYLLLDEIQNLPIWDDWVGRLYRVGVNLIVTGSNANLLSSEMSTKLTGRYVSFEIMPFSLKEIVNGSGDSLARDDAAQQFLTSGGYPELYAGSSLTESYLSSLFDAIISKDVAQRYKVRKLSKLAELAQFLATNCTCEATYNSLAADVDIQSENTVKKFLDYLQNTYLFYCLPMFRSKARLINKTPRKIYMVDNGYISAKSQRVGQNLGVRLENAVFTELIKRGYAPSRDLFYYHTLSGDKEVDFVCRRGGVAEALIQVCYDLGSITTFKREASALNTAASELRCESKTIIVWDYSKIDFGCNDDIRIVRFCDWALE